MVAYGYLDRIEAEAHHPSPIRPWSTQRGSLRQLTFDPQRHHETWSKLLRRVDTQRSAEDLVFSAYCLILNRFPDPEGERYYIANLPRFGVKKVFKMIYYSEEKRKQIWRQRRPLGYVLFQFKRLNFWVWQLFFG